MRKSDIKDYTIVACMWAFAATFSILIVISGMNQANAASFNVSGDTLTISGEIDYEDEKKFEQKFSSNIKNVYLESPGGSADAGKAIGQLIHNRGDINTKAIGNCTSACGMIWLSGAKHERHVGELVGFHLSYVQNDDYHTIQRNDGLNGLTKYVKSAALNDMWWQFFFTNNKERFDIMFKGHIEEGLMSYDMWFPTHAQLVELEGDWYTKPAATTTSKIKTSGNNVYLYAQEHRYKFALIEVFDVNGKRLSYKEWSKRQNQGWAYSRNIKVNSNGLIDLDLGADAKRVHKITAKIQGITYTFYK